MTRTLVALGVLALAALVLPWNASSLPADGPGEAAPATLPNVPAVQPPTLLPIVPDGLSLRPDAAVATPPHEATVRWHLPALAPDTADARVAPISFDAARADVPSASDLGVSGGDLSASDGSAATPSHEGGAAARSPMPVIPPPEPDPVILPVPRLDAA